MENQRREMENQHGNLPNSRTVVEQSYILRQFVMYVQVRLFILISAYIFLLVVAYHNENYLYFPMTLVWLSCISLVEFIIIVTQKRLQKATRAVSYEDKQYMQVRHDLIQQTLLQQEEIRELSLVLKNRGDVIRVISLTDASNAIYAIQNGQSPDKILEIKNDVWSSCPCGVPGCLHIRFARDKHISLISSEPTRKIQRNKLKRMHLSGIHQN